MNKPVTYRDLLRWLRTLDDAQLNAPVMATAGADDFGGTDYYPVVELLTVASEADNISGGYEGPALLIQPQAETPRR
jgi:hypothetical protein